MAKYLDSNGLLYFWGKLKAYFVAKEAGKGLSTNDLTATLKNNYDAAYTHSTAAHAPTDAEKNVQSDWNQTDTNADDFIKNKPTTTVDQTITAGDADAVSSVAVIGYAVQKNNAITGASKCKITYDSKGLVTGGADLTAEDIPNLGATYVPVSSKGQANGVASLGADGLVLSSQLPSYVDDVVELLTIASTAPANPAAGDIYYNTNDTKLYTYNTDWGTGMTPEDGKIYVVLDTNKSYRWGGSVMVQITPGDMAAITNAEIDTVCAA